MEQQTAGDSAAAADAPAPSLPRRDSGPPPPLPDRPPSLPRDGAGGSSEPTEEELAALRLQIRNLDSGERFGSAEALLESGGVDTNYTILPTTSSAPASSSGGVGAAGTALLKSLPSLGKKALKRGGRDDPRGVKVDCRGKACSELASLSLAQEVKIGCKIWVVEFSCDASLLACAGQDGRIYVFRTAAAAAAAAAAATAGEGGNDASDAHQRGASDGSRPSGSASTAGAGVGAVSMMRQLSDPGVEAASAAGADSGDAPFIEVCAGGAAWRTLVGHESDIIDLCWGRGSGGGGGGSGGGDTLLSASTDCTVRLWQVTGAAASTSCVGLFKHPQAVSAVQFHPSYPQVFVSGCLDSRVRLWDTVKSRVLNFKDTKEPVTAARFTPDGKLVLAGLLHGQVMFFSEDLRFFTQIDCRNRKGALKAGRAVTGLAFRPPADAAARRRARSPPPSPRNSAARSAAATAARVQVLVTTADGRLRLYSTDTFEMACKYKGQRHDALHLGARFSEDGRYIVCGSECGRARAWAATVADPAPPGAGRHDTVDAQLSFIAQACADAAAAAGCDAHEATVTLFVPAAAAAAALGGGVGGGGGGSGGGGGGSGGGGSGDDELARYVSAALLVSDTDGCVRVYARSDLLSAA